MDASVGGTKFIATNWPLATLTNYNIRITSTGTNAIGTFGLTRTDLTNSHAWANLSIPGDLLGTVVTNANFWTFLTNYNPQVIIAEVKDSATLIMPGLNWLAANCTNRDIILITPSSNNDEGGLYDQRETMIQFALTNRLNLFDKYGYLLPTNFWFNSMPLSSANIYADGAHLGYKGISYISTAFADWFGAGGEKFAASRLLPRTVGGGGVQTNDTTKAQLVGGNTFSGGNQNFSGAGNQNVFTDQYTEFKRPSGGLFGPALWSPNGNDKMVMQYENDTAFRILNSPSYNPTITFSNYAGNARFDMPANGGGTVVPEIGIGGPFVVNAASIFLKSNALSFWPTAPRKTGDSFLGNSNGVVYLLTSGVGSTWTSTNKIAP